jgi:hypothetical protein
MICGDGFGRLDGEDWGWAAWMGCGNRWSELDGNGWKRWVMRMGGMDRDADGRMEGRVR